MYLFANDIWHMASCLSVCLTFSVVYEEKSFFILIFFVGGVDLKGLCIVHDKLYGSALLPIKVN